MKPLELTDRFVASLKELSFSSPITHVYNPLEYARASYDKYWQLYGQGPREILLLGMNPGPWGMAQNGIPFGDTIMVREWLKIDEPIGKPLCEHPHRPILGWENTRREVSGKRLWGWAKDRFHNPESFFQRFFAINYCPLLFFNERGQNLTPDKLPARDRDSLSNACDKALQHYADYFQPEWVIGIGGYAENSAQRALAETPIRIGRIPHPSPANPAANRGWEKAAEQAFADLGITF